MSQMARIYQLSKSATQSGRANAHTWILEFERSRKPTFDSLTGWSGSLETMTQIKMSFSTREEAETYAKRVGLNYEISIEQPIKIKPKAYADNFR